MNEKTEFNAEHEQPNSVWKHFVRLSEIPRCSKNEKRAVEYVKSIAETYGHSVCQDSAGNLLVRISSTDSFKDSPSVCLQSHLDMVCEKNSDAEHDFSKDPLKLYKQDGMLYAEGTTLGADNGIGAAMMIALCESSEIKHPELELLFTVDEEAGMSGAFALQSDFIQSKRLINLDTEEEGCICIGCSGGLETELNFPVTGMQPGPEFLPYRIEVKNLRGGHSGINIHLKRANAVKILARCLNRLQKSQEVYLSEI
ncbi:MAG: M20/M25/M40 family metallo-hydrolase, partial [Spirochaetia bacterium]|nr:M20/M25/M40 family metallo-hydrolase [Spirochaetia bacterium]